MRKRPTPKLLKRATNHLSRETREYAKIHETLRDVLRVTDFRAQLADVIEAQQVLRIAIEPASQFVRWRGETKQVTKLTNALARLVLGRDKSKWSDEWFDVKPNAKPNNEDDILW